MNCLSCDNKATKFYLVKFKTPDRTHAYPKHRCDACYKHYADITHDLITEEEYLALQLEAKL